MSQLLLMLKSLALKSKNRINYVAYTLYFDMGLGGISKPLNQKFKTFEPLNLKIFLLSFWCLLLVYVSKDHKTFNFIAYINDKLFIQ